MPFNSVRACPEDSKKAPPERKDFPRAGGRCRVATKGGVWNGVSRDGEGEAVSLIMQA